MPTTYAHDLFGKKIYAKLPAEIQKVIRRNTNLYRIGLHGPDILFYDMLKPKVTETGIAMHKECAAPFFERGMTLVRTTHDEKLLAYLLGFGCHYLLDSACHPFVYEMAERNVISHTLLEKEFDRTLMLETHKIHIIIPGLWHCSPRYVCTSDSQSYSQNTDEGNNVFSKVDKTDHQLSCIR